MNIKKTIFSFCVFFLTCSPVFAERAFQAVTLTMNPITWPRTDIKTFGCFLEKNLRYRHPKYHCDLKKYQNRGAPKFKPEEYYEGPSFPDSKIQQIHPAIVGIELSWEHGELQEVRLAFRKGIGPSQIREFFHLPLRVEDGPPNLMSYDIQSSATRSHSLILQGFEHQGAGD